MLTRRDSKPIKPDGNNPGTRHSSMIVSNNRTAFRAIVDADRI